jgi:hypothetical protein
MEGLGIGHTMVGQLGWEVLLHRAEEYQTQVVDLLTLVARKANIHNLVVRVHKGLESIHKDQAGGLCCKDTGTLLLLFLLLFLLLLRTQVVVLVRKTSTRCEYEQRREGEKSEVLVWLCNVSLVQCPLDHWGRKELEGRKRTRRGIRQNGPWLGHEINHYSVCSG